jgi:hypothetical protein
MKFPKIKISTPKTSVNLNVSLTVVLLLLLAVEGYWIFSNLYVNLAVNTDIIAPSNIVRVDLDAYQDTIDLLDDLKNYKPDVLQLKRGNPFK